MKKISFLLMLLLMGCGFNYHTSDISRNQVYYGQTVVDLFDNFGAPKKVEKYSYRVIAYIFTQEQIVQENVDKYFKYCDLRVFTRNERVIDWDFQGNNCQFKVNDKVKMTLFDHYDLAEE